MQLTLAERDTLLTVLPSEGNFATLRTIHKLQQQLSPSEEEWKSVNARIEADRVVWDTNLEPPGGHDIPIGEIATELIVQTLKKLNDQNRLTMKHLSLYEKFVEQKNADL